MKSKFNVGQKVEIISDSWRGDWCSCIDETSDPEVAAHLEKCTAFGFSKSTEVTKVWVRREVSLNGFREEFYYEVTTKPGKRLREDLLIGESTNNPVEHRDGDYEFLDVLDAGLYYELELDGETTVLKSLEDLDSVLNEIYKDPIVKAANTDEYGEVTASLAMLTRLGREVGEHRVLTLTYACYCMGVWFSDGIMEFELSKFNGEGNKLLNTRIVADESGIIKIESFQGGFMEFCMEEDEESEGYYLYSEFFENAKLVGQPEEFDSDPYWV